MRRIAIFILALGVIAAGMAGWLFYAWTAAGPAAKPSVVLIPPRRASHDIARQLQEAGAVSNAMLFEAELRLRGLSAKVKAGEYALQPQASMADIAAILVAGKSILHKLTVAEGLTSDMVHKLIAADPVLAGNAGPVPAEGALLPETYLFTRGTSRAELIDRMEEAEKKFLAAHWAGRAPGLPLATPEQAVILASIVEKETARPEERRHIAAVFVNRLKLGMRLQSDPTIIYGITRGYPLGRGIRESEIEAATPYNTYAVDGLPPTPICNPGKDSLAAVLEPEASNDLYFVADGEGGHVFAATIAQHQRNVAAWRATERARRAPPVEKPAPRPAHRRRRAG
jgi:UPF0755 protein